MPNRSCRLRIHTARHPDNNGGGFHCRVCSGHAPSRHSGGSCSCSLATGGRHEQLLLGVARQRCRAAAADAISSTCRAVPERLGRL